MSYDLNTIIDALTPIDQSTTDINKYNYQSELQKALNEKVLSQQNNKWTFSWNNNNPVLSFECREGFAKMFKHPLLNLAASKGLCNIIRFLLEDKVSVNASPYGNTALYDAVSDQQKEAVELLLQYEADVSIQSRCGNTALHIAASQNNTDIAQILLEKLDKNKVVEFINTRDNDSGTALHYAVTFNNDAMVTLLLQHGADVSIQNKPGKTALHIAASKNNTDIAQILLEKLDKNKVVEFINTRDNNSDTALHYAAVFSNELNAEMVKLLIERGADVSIQNARGKTALHIATRENNTNVVQILLDKLGNDKAQSIINTTSGCNNTALHYAAAFGNAEMVKLLIERGADITLKDKNNATALDLARGNGHTEIVTILNKKCNNKAIQEGQGNATAHEEHRKSVTCLQDTDISDVNTSNSTVGETGSSVSHHSQNNRSSDEASASSLEPARKSNLAMRIASAATVCFAGAACYLAMYMPEAEMLLPVLNISVNYAHVAIATAAVCAITALAIAVWCRASPSNDMVRPGTNLTDGNVNNQKTIKII